MAACPVQQISPTEFTCHAVTALRLVNYVPIVTCQLSRDFLSPFVSLLSPFQNKRQNAPFVLPKTKEDSAAANICSRVRTHPHKVLIVLTTPARPRVPIV